MFGFLISFAVLWIICMACAIWLVSGVPASPSPKVDLVKLIFWSGVCAFVLTSVGFALVEGFSAIAGLGK